MNNDRKKGRGPKRRKRRRGTSRIYSLLVPGLLLILFLLAVRFALLYSKFAGSDWLSGANESIMSVDTNMNSDDDENHLHTFRGEEEEDSPAAALLSEDDLQTTILVNAEHGIPEDYTPVLCYIDGSHLVDERCYDALRQMLDDCARAGYSPLVCSAYRTSERQKELLEEEIQKYLAQGMEEANARVLASQGVALPGHSEHELGLAVDIVDSNYQLLDEKQENTPVQQWLMKHCWEYGFVLRYPVDKTYTTGFEYEPWHYRYVGKALARYMYEQGICLEKVWMERQEE